MQTVKCLTQLSTDDRSDGFLALELSAYYVLTFNYKNAAVKSPDYQTASP